MASDKAKRKAAKATKPTTGPKPHPDGDRRRRGGADAKAAIRQKRGRNQGERPPLL